jgi:hypothetical protein
MSPCLMPADGDSKIHFTVPSGVVEHAYGIRPAWWRSCAVLRVQHRRHASGSHRRVTWSFTDGSASSPSTSSGLGGSAVGMLGRTPRTHHQCELAVVDDDLTRTLSRCGQRTRRSFAGLFLRPPRWPHCPGSHSNRTKTCGIVLLPRFASPAADLGASL